MMVELEAPPAKMPRCASSLAYVSFNQDVLVQKLLNINSENCLLFDFNKKL